MRVLSFSFVQILPQDLLKKYLTYAKLNVFPRLHDADLDKLTHVYAELRRESSVSFLLIIFDNSFLSVDDLMIYPSFSFCPCSMDKECP